MSHLRANVSGVKTPYSVHSLSPWNKRKCEGEREGNASFLSNIVIECLWTCQSGGPGKEGFLKISDKLDWGFL